MITSNFRQSEFSCKCADKNCIGKRNFTNVKLVVKLEILREMVGNLPITITSGIRCPAHNKAVGGIEKSLHLEGNAVDFVIQGKRPYEYFYLVEKIFGTGGVGYYNGFCHVDSGKKQRWVG